jgi:hypothetical protein
MARLYDRFAKPSEKVALHADLTMLARLAWLLLEREQFQSPPDAVERAIEARSDKREVALLTILIGCGEKAIEAFHASDNPIDADFVVDLERVIDRSRQELAALLGKTPPT